MRWLRRSLICLALLAGGCASTLPPPVERTATHVLHAPADSALATVVRDAAIPADRSGVWPLLQAHHALDARLALIEHASTSLDLQYYLIGNDAVGRQILRALRDAALRGVRVRLLLDDLDTVGMDPLLLGLAAHPNVEVRLFNPFITARASWLSRVLALAGDFRRLNHRMHNKLFVADGALAIVGGRNLADEYFLRGREANFIDFDVLLAGRVVAELDDWFDIYWNSPRVYPLGDVVRASGGDADAEAATLRSRFDDATRAEQPYEPPDDIDLFGAAPLGAELAHHQVRLLPVECTTYADSPDKIDPDHFSVPVDDTLNHRFLQRLGDAHREVDLYSPYFIPGPEALEHIARLRAHGVTVRVITNTLAVSDAPLVNLRARRHRGELLTMGVELYELSSTRLKRDRGLRRLFGTSTGRLHAKLAILDRKTLLVGSMNLDPRSASINTEIGVRVVGPSLAEMVLGAVAVDRLPGLYRVELPAHGPGVRWVAVDGSADPADEFDV